MDWYGSHPYCLVVISGDKVTLIDLDEPQWMRRHAELMRTPGRWILSSKNSVPVLTMVVATGEQPYVVTRIFKPLREQGEVREVRVYGMGKKRRDGHVDRLWILPGGIICGGDDVDPLGNEMVQQRRNDGQDAVH